jgi:hypothetical protein
MRRFGRHRPIFFGHLPVTRCFLGLVHGKSPNPQICSWDTRNKELGRRIFWVQSAYASSPVPDLNRIAVKVTVSLPHGFVVGLAGDVDRRGRAVALAVQNVDAVRSH